MLALLKHRSLSVIPLIDYMTLVWVIRQPTKCLSVFPKVLAHRRIELSKCQRQALIEMVTRRNTSFNIQISQVHTSTQPRARTCPAVKGALASDRMKVYSTSLGAGESSPNLPLVGKGNLKSMWHPSQTSTSWPPILPIATRSLFSTAATASAPVSRS